MKAYSKGPKENLLSHHMFGGGRGGRQIPSHHASILKKRHNGKRIFKIIVMIIGKVFKATSWFSSWVLHLDPS